MGKMLRDEDGAGKEGSWPRRPLCSGTLGPDRVTPASSGQA